MAELGVLDFEKPIFDLNNKIEELKKLSEEENLDLDEEIEKLTKKVNRLKVEIFSDLDPWQQVQLARHPMRPHTEDFVKLITDDFVEVHGDRLFADDMAILCGFGTMGDYPVAIVGHNKGRTTEVNLKRNFGSPHPEGFRKALRVMKLADKLSIPILTFLDTAGAYPGIGAEERGQAEAIARNILEMFKLSVPMIVNVVGEGGSGGALGIGIGNVVLMLENSYYSVISPEGCAAILWRDRAEAPKSSEILRITSDDLYKLGVIDEIVEEPLGGAHSDYEETAENLKKAILKHLDELSGMNREELKVHKREKFRKMGFFAEDLKSADDIIKSGKRPIDDE